MHPIQRIALLFIASICACFGAAHPVGAKVRVVASINDLASIAATVGGDAVEVSAVARAGSDVHRVEVLPSYMVRVSKADLYLKVGLGLDQWADAIIDGSRNGGLVIFDCSRNVSVLDKPTGKVDASMGDIHPSGNPHYWLDPRNGGVIAEEIAEALGRLDPQHAADFKARAANFAGECEKVYAEGCQRVDTLPGHDIVTYHASWNYLAKALGLNVAATIEPIPGIPPTASHLKDLVDLIEARRILVVIYEPYFSSEAAEFLQRETHVRLAKLAPSCDKPEAGSYLAHFRAIYDTLAGSS